LDEETRKAGRRGLERGKLPMQSYSSQVEVL
jgi:hypothetical protein